MENHIYNQIELTFYNFQPVAVSNIATDDLFKLKVDTTKLSKFTTHDMPAWLIEFNHSKTVYNNIKSISLDIIDTKLLLDELAENFIVNGLYPLSNYLSKEDISCFLLFDISTFHWMICYELRLKINQSDLFSIISAETDNHSNNLYTSIRNVFVKEYDHSVKSKWVCDIEKKVFKKIEVIISSVYNYEINHSDLFVDNNSGNISNVTVLNNDNLPLNKRITDALIEVNRISERVEYFDEPIQLNHTTTYSFNGRFHTIITNNAKYRYRFLPIQYQMQFMWNYLDYIYKKMDDINNAINISNDRKINKRKIEVIDHIINKVQYLRVFHENFKRAIENDNSLVYSKIEKKWNIENFIETTNQYVDNFVSFIDRLYAKKGDKNSKKQNNLLFVLSIIQTIALMSVWNDYISIVNPNNITSSKSVIALFGSVDKLLRFNVLLPLIFIGIIIIFMMYTIIGSGKDD